MVRQMRNLEQDSLTLRVYRELRREIVDGRLAPGSALVEAKLSKELGIPHYDLDDLQWDNQSESYGIKRNAAERDKLLAELLRQKDWILEGVYYAWCQKCFADADQIYVLSVPRHTYRYRILRRFVRRKLGLEQGKKESLRSLVQLLKWADHYQIVQMAEIKELLTPYADKVIQ